MTTKELVAGPVLEDAHQTFLFLSDGTRVAVWLFEDEKDTWGRVPGFTYGVTEHNADGAVVRRLVWTVSPQGELLVQLV